MSEPRLALALAFLFLVSCGEHDFVDFLEKGENPSSSSGKEEEDGEVDSDPCTIAGYRTVVIGTQTWMAENFNCYVEGSVCYDNDPANCEKYGRLYDWETALTACPQGWHIPTQSEWEILKNFVQSDNGCVYCDAKFLKSTGWNDDGNGLDSYGFDGLPGGIGFANGNFYNVGYDGVWWSATDVNETQSYTREMYYLGIDAVWSASNKVDLHSVRCVLD